jgi:hypothetical protein
VEPPLWAPRRVNRPSKHSDGRLSSRERVVAFGLLLFVFWCEGTWLDCFARVGDMNVYRGYTKPTRVDKKGSWGCDCLVGGLETT